MTDEARQKRRLAVTRVAFEALGKHRGNTKAAAADIGLKERTLREQVAEYCELMGFLTPFEAAWHRGERENGGMTADR